MKQAVIAGLIGAVIGGGISALVGYLAPVPMSNITAALASGVAGGVSAFLSGFMAIVTQRRKP